MQAKASRACRALRPLSREASGRGGWVGTPESVFGEAGAGPHAVPVLFGVALIVSVKPAMVADSFLPGNFRPIPWLARTILLCCTLQGIEPNRNISLGTADTPALRFYARDPLRAARMVRRVACRLATGW